MCLSLYDYQSKASRYSSGLKVTQSCLTLGDPMDYTVQNTGVGSLSLLQRIFPTQGLNPDLPHCTQILYQLSHKRSSTILEWVDYPFSSVSSWPRSRTGVSCIVGEFFTKWAIREALRNGLTYLKQNKTKQPRIITNQKYTVNSKKPKENTSIIQKKTIISQKVKHKGKERNEEKLRIPGKQGLKWQYIHQYQITLNVHGLTVPFNRHLSGRWIKKQESIICLPTRDRF